MRPKIYNNPMKRTLQLYMLCTCREKAVRHFPIQFKCLIIDVIDLARNFLMANATHMYNIAIAEKIVDVILWQLF